MARQEQLRGHRPEEKNIEPELPQPEVGERSSQLISEFVQALKQTPEFTQALQDSYFSQRAFKGDIISKEYNPLSYPIDFEKGGYKYSVQYQTKTEREKLIVEKEIPYTVMAYFVKGKPPEPTLWIGREDMSLSSHINQDTGEFYGGFIDYEKISYDEIEKRYPGESHRNTHTAFERVEEFLKSNFGESQAQTPPQQ